VPLTVGVDVGTQGSKAGVFDTDGALLGRGYAPHTITYPRPGYAEMEPDALVEAALSSITAALADAHHNGHRTDGVEGVSAVALSGVLVGQVLLDDCGSVLHPLITSLDTRSAGHAAAAVRDLEPRWLTESGTSTLDAYAAPFMLQWVRDNRPEIWRRVHRTVSVAPYVSARIAGLTVDEMYTDPTHISGWMVGWDDATRGFSPEQLAAFGIPADILPRTVASDAVVGSVTADVAARTGLPAGTPVVAGAGDVMQSSLASGVVEAGQAADVAGTTSILTVGTTGVIPSVTAIPGMLYSLSTVPGQSLYWGYIRAGGLSLRWFRDAVARAASTDYAEFDRLADGVPPGSNGVLFLPYLAGGNPDNPDASGTWLGMESGTDTATLWRSALEAVAFEYETTLTVFRDAGMDLSEVLVTGGGAASATWNRIKADLTGVPWRVPARLDGPVLANAALANQALGRGTMVDQLRQWNAGGSVYTPDDAAHDVYSRAAAVRRDLLSGPMMQTFALVRTLRDL
jgi:xylulokinase